MGIEKSVLERLNKLPVEKRQEALDFVEFLETKPARIVIVVALKGRGLILG